MSEKTIAFTVDEDFHKEIKLRIAESGQFLKGYIIGLIKEDLVKASAEQKVKIEEYSIEDALEKEKELREILNHIAKKK